MNKPTPAALRALLTAAAALLTWPAQADFAVVLSPPRFELEAKAGTVLRRTLEIANAGKEPIRLSVRTADWLYRPDGAVDFLEPLQPGSCRPWVAIERQQVTVRPERPYRLRFEVTTPADAPASECRFALLVEGLDEGFGKAGDLSIPFTGRLAAIVYVGVGGVEPQLAIVGPAVRQVNGEATPVLIVHNKGTAHGRLRGLLSGADADGTSLEFAPSGEPVMPGETRAIPLVATRRGEPAVRFAPRLPIQASGSVEWGAKQSLDIDFRFPP